VVAGDGHRYKLPAAEITHSTSYVKRKKKKEEKKKEKEKEKKKEKKKKKKKKKLDIFRTKIR